MSGPLVGRVTAWEINYFIANYKSPAGKLLHQKLDMGVRECFVKSYVCRVLLCLLGLTFMSKKIICCDKYTLIVFCLVTYTEKYMYIHKNNQLN